MKWHEGKQWQNFHVGMNSVISLRDSNATVQGWFLKHDRRTHKAKYREILVLSQRHQEPPQCPQCSTQPMLSLVSVFLFAFTIFNPNAPVHSKLPPLYRNRTGWMLRTRSWKSEVLVWAELDWGHSGKNVRETSWLKFHVNQRRNCPWTLPKPATVKG